MIKLEIVGNLGADAEIKQYNGNKFVSFRVAHSEKWVDRQTGAITTQTTWVSCSLNGVFSFCFLSYFLNITSSKRKGGEHAPTIDA